MPKFEYNRPTRESMKSRANARIGGWDSPYSDKYEPFKPQDGKNSIRILPASYKKADGTPADHYGLEIWVHYGVGADGGTYLCLEKMKGEKCPMCEYVQDLMRDGLDKDSKKMKHKQRMLYFVINRKSERDGPLLWAAPISIDKDLAKICTADEVGECLFPDDPVDGYDIYFSKSGAGKKTEYDGIAVARRSSPLSDDLNDVDDWLEWLGENDLMKAIVYHDYAYLKKVLEGQVEGKQDNEEDDEDGPRMRNGRRAASRDDDDKGGRSRRSRGDDDEEDDRGRGGRTRSRRDDDDEEDDKGGRNSSRDDRDRDRDRDEKPSRDDRDSRPARDDRKDDREEKPKDEKLSRPERRPRDDRDSEDDRGSRDSRDDRDERKPREDDRKEDRKKDDTDDRAMSARDRIRAKIQSRGDEKK